MKKILGLILSIALVFSLAACGNSNSSEVSESESTESAAVSDPESIPESSSTETAAESTTLDEEPVEFESGKILVVYFSMPETTDPDNMTEEEDNSVVVIDGEVLGNTQYVAYVIQENTGADIFRIEPATPYPTDHDTLVDLAAEEQDQDARPGDVKQNRKFGTVRHDIYRCI